jgi:phage terminase small subunit
MTKRKDPSEPRLKARPGEGTFRSKRGANAGGNVAQARARGIDTGSAARAALVDVDKPLTQLQKAFVKLWASGETILSASIKAGYADGGTYAYRMVRMPNILKLYNEEKLAYEAAANMSRKKVMDMLVEAYDAAKILEEPASMVSAAREIGKMCGYYEPVTIKHQVTHDGKIVTERLNTMDDDQLLEFIAQQMAAIAQPQAPALPAPEDEEEGVTDVTAK